MGFLIFFRNSACAALSFSLGAWLRGARGATFLPCRGLHRPGGAESERRLPAADQLKIDLGQQLGIEQGAVPGACRVVDSEAAAQCVQVCRRAGELATREADGVDRARLRQGLSFDPAELGIEEPEIELGVVDDQHRIAEEGEQVVHHRAEQRLVREELIGQTMDLERAGRHLPLGIDVSVVRRAGRDVVDQLDAADLDDTVAALRVETGGFGVEDDFAHSGPAAVDARAAANTCRGGGTSL